MESVEEWDTVVLRILRTERISRSAVEEEWESALRRAVLVPFTVGCGDVGFERMVEVDEPHMRDAIGRHEELCRSRYLTQVHASVRLHVLSGSPSSTSDPSAYFYYSDLASSGPNAMSLPDSFYHTLQPPTEEAQSIVNRTVPPHDVSRGHRGAEQAGRADIANEELSDWHTILDMQASVKVAQFAVGLGQLEEAWRGEVEMDEFEARHFYIIRPYCQLMASRLQSSGPGGASFVSNVAIQTALGAYYRRNNLRVPPSSSSSYLSTTTNMMPSLYSNATSPALRQESILMHLQECFTASSSLGRPIGAPPTPFPHGSEPITRLLIAKMEAQARINVAAVYISCRLVWEEEWGRMKVQLAHNFWKLGCLKPIFNEVIVKEQKAWEDLQGMMKPFLDNVKEEVGCIQARRARVDAKRKWFEALHEREREKRIEMGLNRDQFTLLMKAEQLQTILDVQDRYVSMAIVASERAPTNRQIANGGAGRELALQWGQRDVDEDDLHVTDEDATRERVEQEGVLPGITSRLLALTDVASGTGGEGGMVVAARDAPSTLADRFHRDLQALTSPTTTMQDLRSYHQGLVVFESTLTRGEEDLLGDEWLEYQSARRRQLPPPTTAASPPPNQQVGMADESVTPQQQEAAGNAASRSPSFGSSLMGASPTWAQDEWGRPMHSSPSQRIHAAHAIHTTAAHDRDATFASPKPRLPWSEAPAGRSQSEVASRRGSDEAAPLQQPIPTPHYMTSLFGGRSSSRDFISKSDLDVTPQMSWGVSRSNNMGASPRTVASPPSHQYNASSPLRGTAVPASRGTSVMSASGVGVRGGSTANHPAHSSPSASGSYPTSKWYEPSSPRPTRPGTAATATSPYSPPRQPLMATLDSRSVSVSTTGGERRPLMGVPLPVRSGSAASSVQSFPASLASYQYH